jgi:hypothetical protein
MTRRGLLGCLLAALIPTSVSGEPAIKIVRKIWSIARPKRAWQKFHVYIRCGHSPLLFNTLPTIAVVRCAPCELEARGYLTKNVTVREAIAKQDKSERIPWAERGPYHEQPARHPRPPEVG